ncbi:hemolysin family protein [Conexibacter arvalis]|uniref:CBS domain containing-hemolysin-like protein n=1 Tax=Conexibacter arvalis TaxID=912552 RepID=A0A840IG85_9ACTN|nr:hemolysin family protein [Conexibacter arvalis]MBB4663872.1 CBS domain containing-hemolysin-like protein [Conexibacter arvalis]
MPAVQLVLALLLLLANGFFVAAEFSLTRLRPTRVDELERSGRPGARSVRHAVERIDAYLAACQLGITVASLGLGALGERAFERLLAPLLGDHARLGGIGLSAGLAFLLITMLHVVVGELSPKSVAIARTERIVLLVAPPMRAFYAVTRPLVDLLNGLGNLLLRPFGIPPAREAGHSPHSETELRALVAESGREGMIAPEEQQFTDNVFTFGDIRADEAMVPWREVHRVASDATWEEAIGAIRDCGRTRLPVCTRAGGRERVVGILHAKDLLLAERRDRPPAALSRPVERVPAATLLDDVLDRLRAHRAQVAVVERDDGVPAGLVALEDVLEQIVGPIDDEFDRPAVQQPLPRHRLRPYLPRSRR